ncbi:MAG TPA: AgmX/PglI C-terminal domain-containing protein, partial [Polyangiaceae bacterium]
DSVVHGGCVLGSFVRRLVLLGSVTCSIGGCHRAPPAASPAPESAPSPPPHVPSPNPTPEVSVAAGKVLLDGAAVDEITGVAEKGALHLFHGLFDALKSARTAWVAAHPGAVFPGAISFHLDDGLPLVVAKSIFQTAAFAGYPNAAFVLPRVGAPGQSVTLSFGAIVSPMDDVAVTRTTEGPRLLVDVNREGPVTMSWIVGSATVATSPPLPAPGTPGFGAELGRAVSAEWLARGQHRASTDPEPDHAILRVGNDVPYSTVTEVMDAVYEPKRDRDSGGRVERVSAFDIRISINLPGSPEQGLITSGVKGRLAPELIQVGVHENYAKLRACYEAGLGRSATLQGKVEVRFKIELDGKVSSAETTKETTLADPEAVECMLGVYRSLAFPNPDGGTVTVLYPIVFSPG